MKSIIWALLVVLMLSDNGICADTKELAPRKIRLVFNTGEAVIVTMWDTPASRDFMNLLPLQAEFQDYAGEEKITYLPRKLKTEDTPSANELPADFTYYRPWGNLAVFYRGFGQSDQLAVLGRIESGKEKLAAKQTAFSARIEEIE